MKDNQQFEMRLCASYLQNKVEIGHSRKNVIMPLQRLHRKARFLISCVHALVFIGMNFFIISVSAIPGTNFNRESFSSDIDDPEASFEDEKEVSKEMGFDKINFDPHVLSGSSDDSSKASLFFSLRERSMMASECKDNDSYRSPFNDLKCFQMATSGTDCAAWAYLGLDSAQVDELIENCPLSCGECKRTAKPSHSPVYESSLISVGSMQKIKSTFDFFIYPIMGIMDTKTQKTFEDLMIQYFSVLLITRDLSSNITIEDVKLNSQAQIHANRRRSLRHRGLKHPFTMQHSSSRSTQDEIRFLSDFMALRVNITVIASSMIVNSSVLSDLLLPAVDSPIVSEFLQTDTFFQNASVSTSLGSLLVGGVAVMGNDENGGETDPTTTIFISFAGALVALIITTGTLIWRKRRKNRAESGAFFTFSPKNFHATDDEAETEGDLKEGDIFSVEESPCNQRGIDLTITRSVSTADDHYTEENPSQDSIGTRTEVSCSQASISDTVNECDKAAPDSVQNISRVHIPPMIVIDNIEQNMDENAAAIGSISEQVISNEGSDARDGSSEMRIHEGSNMPVRRIEASSQFAAALAARRKADASHTLTGMLRIDTMPPNDCTKESSDLAKPYVRSLQTLNQDDDKHSVSSTPVRSENKDDHSPHHSRRALSSGELIKIESSEPLSEIFRSKWNNHANGAGKISPDVSDEVVHQDYTDEISESNTSTEQLSLGGGYSETPRNMVWLEVSQDVNATDSKSTKHKGCSIASNLVYNASIESTGSSDHMTEDNSIDPKESSDTSNVLWPGESHDDHSDDISFIEPRGSSVTSNALWSEGGEDDDHSSTEPMRNFVITEPVWSQGRQDERSDDEPRDHGVASNIVWPEERQDERTDEHVPTIKLHGLEEDFGDSQDIIVVTQTQEKPVFECMALPSRLNVNDSHSVSTHSSGQSMNISASTNPAYCEASSSVGSTTVDVLVAPGSVSKTSNGSPTQRSRTCSDESTIVGGFRYTFDAPTKGKLGLIIESSKKLGPTIHTVKDYSPLFGMVQTGDKIIRLDGEWTSHMNTGEFTRLLSQKRAEKASGILQITVLTMYEKPDFRCDEDSPRRSGKQSSSNSASGVSKEITFKEESDSDSESGCHLIGAIASYESWDMYESDNESVLTHL